MSRTTYKPGDPVIFYRTRVNTHPVPSARDIHPAPKGETYSYQVAEYGRVLEAHDGQVVLVTPDGATHVVSVRDPSVRHAHWWERLLHFRDFPPRTPPRRSVESPQGGPRRV